jgi:uncharacterized membrane protein
MTEEARVLEQILRYLDQAGVAISLFAVAVIIAGFALASGRYALRFREVAPVQNFSGFKIELGHALLLGLEILVLADVIETITVTPTFGSLGVLAFLVIVRTAVSWTLTLETEGRWPWQPPVEDQQHA